MDRVFKKWQSAKQLIEWKVIPPTNTQEQEQKIKVMKYAIYGTDALIVLVALLSYFFNTAFGLDKTAALIFMCLTIFIAAVSVFISAPLLLKNMKKAITVKIDRDKKIGTISSQQQIKKLKYAEQAVLPSFMLPRNAEQHYEQKRRELQQQISAETGFVFE